MYQKEPELPDAKQYILDALAQNKLVFIGENHAQVSEEIFMAENMQAFYDAGLRYIFGEGQFTDYSPVSSQSPLPVSQDNRIWLFPPWRYDIGGRYVGNLVDQAVRKINDAVPEAERIWFISAEAGLNQVQAEGTDLNKRDQQAFKNISEFMEKLPLNKKAMIFYGASHGEKKPIAMQTDGGEPFLWTPMGVYLKERYGDNFISMGPIGAKDEMQYTALDIPELRDIGSGPKIVPSNSKNDIVNDDRIHQLLPQWDAILLFREAIYGTGFNYVPTYGNLFLMYNTLQYLEDRIDNWKDDVAIYRVFDHGQYLQLIYYLKLWLGDSFDYRLWDTTRPAREVIRLRDSRKTLREALNELNSITINEIAVRLNAQDARNTQKMRDYSMVMLTSALQTLVFEDFDPSIPREELFQEMFPWIAEHMKEAIAIFPQDLWGYYWLAYAETELRDYDAAIEHWEYIIAQPLSSCLETLPRVYEKLSVCYTAKGKQARSDEYKRIGAALVNEHDLIVTNLNDVR
jgi:tetratricopeptide (TPR) repeat protein